MGHKSFYRKYRPTSFEEVVGQDAIVKTLLNSIKLNKISHAYIFSGTRGTGKTSIAKNFAKAVNCFNLKNGVPCNDCDICNTINTDEVQDIIEIDAASNNGVDEVRELKSKVNLVPTMCKYKVYIIDEVHMLSTGAFNALLKTLEEPPSHVIFILATTEIQKIPSTILSRCQRFDFKKISVEKISERLSHICDVENIKISESSLYEISRVSDGSMRDAISFLDQVSMYTDMNITTDAIYEISGTVSGKEIQDFVSGVIDENIELSLDFLEKINNEGKDFYRFAEDVLFFLRNVLLAINAPKYYKKKKSVDKDYIDNIKVKINTEKLMLMIQELNGLMSDIKRSSNPKILFELFIFNINDSKNAIKKEVKVDIEEVKEKKIDSNLNVKKTKDDTIDIVEKNDGNELKLNIVNEEKEILSEYKKAIINNTLAKANREDLKNVKEKWRKIQTFLLDDVYKESARILLDSNISAAGKNYILLTYKYECMVIEHDKNNKRINELINNIFNSKQKVVSISENNWNELRPHYIELKKKNKKIDLIEEKEEVIYDTIKQKDSSNQMLDDAISIFGEELVEMER